MHCWPHACCHFKYQTSWFNAPAWTVSFTLMYKIITLTRELNDIENLTLIVFNSVYRRRTCRRPTCRERTCRLSDCWVHGLKELENLSNYIPEVFQQGNVNVQWIVVVFLNVANTCCRGQHNSPEHIIVCYATTKRSKRSILIWKAVIKQWSNLFAIRKYTNAALSSGS